MILYGFLGLVALSAFVAALRWRLGIILMVFVAMLQDPVRKMIPGTPAYLVLATVPVWAGIVIGAAVEGGLEWQRFRSMFPRLSWAILLFLVFLIPPAILSATYSAGSWQVTLLGLYAHLSVVVGMVLGTYYPRAVGDTEKLFLWYCILVSLMLIGAPLERLRLGGATGLVGTRTMGHYWVTYRTGGTVRMLAGFFRSPDVMGWHAAMLVMLGITLALNSSGMRRHAYAAMAGWGAIGVMLCGRRKMMGMLPFFVVCFLLLHLLFRQPRRVVSLAISVILVLLVGLYAYTELGADPELESFYYTTASELGDRLAQHGVAAVITTYRQAGFFGYGLGMATQGTHHIDVPRPRVWQEGGLGKIMAELGLPGFVCFVLLLATLLATGSRVLARVSTTTEYSMYFGLTSLIAANGIGAIVSAQIFGDPFVGSFLPFLIGLLLSGARLRRAEKQGKPTGR